MLLSYYIDKFFDPCYHLSSMFNVPIVNIEKSLTYENAPVFHKAGRGFCDFLEPL